MERQYQHYTHVNFLINRKRKLIPHTIRMGHEVDSLAWKQDANLYQYRFPLRL